MANIKITDKIISDIVRMYKDERKSVNEIASKVGCNPSTISHRLRQLGFRKYSKPSAFERGKGCCNSEDLENIKMYLRSGDEVKALVESYDSDGYLTSTLRKVEIINVFKFIAQYEAGGRSGKVRTMSFAEVAKHNPELINKARRYAL